MGLSWVVYFRILVIICGAVNIPLQMNNFEISEEIIVEVTLNNLWHFVAFYSATSAGNLFGFLTFVIVKNVNLISLIKHPDICQGNRTKKVR